VFKHHKKFCIFDQRKIFPYLIGTNIDKSRKSHYIKIPMKRTTIFQCILIVVVLLSTLPKAHSQIVYLSEGFEHGGSKPVNWTNDSYVKPISGGVNWRFQNGGHTTNPAIPLSGHPNAAHSGNYNALFQFQSLNNEATKLITKTFSLEFAVKAELHFWHAQDEWYNLGSWKHDILKVYYRKAATQAWTLLATYDGVQTGWTERIILLPEASYSPTYEIAFEGITGSGWGVCIDDVSVVETGLKDRQVDSVFFDQKNSNIVPSGTQNNPIGMIGIKVSGNVGNLTLDGLTLTSKNSNDLDIETGGVKIFKTTSNVFNNKTPIGSGQSYSAGSALFTALATELQTGYNYIWVTYDVKSDANPTDTLDFKIPIGGVKTSSLSYTPTTPNPSGFRTIRKSVFTDDLEGTAKWSLTGEFQIGSPQGKGGSIGKPDPTFAQSGSNILGTDITGLGSVNGDYEPNLSKDQYTATLTNHLDLTYYKDIKLSIARYLNVDLNDKVSIQISLDGGVTWKEKWSNQAVSQSGDTIKSGYIENDWNYFELALPEATRQSNVKLRFSVGKTDDSQNFSGWNIDDIAITANYLDKDVSVTDWTSPIDGCNLGTAASVTIKVQNNAAFATPSVVPVAYSINNGTTWIQETINESIPAGGSKTYTFNTKVNLSVAGLYPHVLAKTILAGDKEPSNDQFSTSIFSAPTILPPYNESFTTTDGYWRATNSLLWKHGVISNLLQHDSPSDKAWATSLVGSYLSVDSIDIVSIFADDFETNKGWTFSGEFERGAPSGGGGGVGSGNPDPYSSNSGSKVIGTDVSGITLGTPFNYEPNINEANAYYATSPTIDLTNYREVTLNYWRYLNVDEGDSIKVQVSKNNGATWTTLWKAGTRITDFSWNEVNTPIPDSLINTSQFKIRFGLTYTNGDLGYSGWNIDDLTLTGDIFTKNEAVVESPCFDMTGIAKPLFQCDINYQTEKNIDGAALFYSIDNGVTWNPVANNGDQFDSRWNWYKDSTVSSLGTDGWSGFSNGWKTVKHLLPSSIANIPCVKFKIDFKCDQYNNEYAGVAIDNIKITEAPNDFGISTLVSPQTACYLSNNEPISVKIKNYGVRTAKAGEAFGISISINHEGIIQSSSQVVNLASDLPVNGELNLTLSQIFNFNAHGDYIIKIATTGELDSKVYYDLSNDTLTTTVRVKGMPEFTLGPDIGTTDATTIILDAGAGMASYLWQDNTTTTQTFNVPSFGLYSVTVINGEGCEAKDTIEVVNSNKNVGVSAITGLGNSCTHSSAEKPTITIKNYGLTNLASGLSIPIGVKVNNVVVATDAVVLASDLAPDATIDYALTNGFDLSTKGEYTVSIYTNLPIEVSRLNDTTTIPANTFGLPTVNFEKAEIATTNPVGTILTAIASPNITLYSWKNETLNTPVGTNSTNYAIETSSSAIYSVTVTDNNACGTASASIAINAKDLGILSIDQPLNSICSSKPTDIKVTLKNFGQDTYASGSKVKLTYTTAESTNEEEFTFPSPIGPGGSLALTFANRATFETGNNFVKITSDITGDADDSNNELEKPITVQPLPTVNIEQDTLYKVFGSTDSYTILPNYSADVTDYEWQDLSTNDSYTISGYPLFTKYMVIAKTSLGCLAKDSLVVISGDLMLSAIKSPTNKCALEDNTDIITTILNSGSTTYPAGTKITINANLNGNALTPEEYTLVSDLAPQSTIDYTLTQKANLAGLQNFLIEIVMHEPHEFVLSNNTVSRTGNATGLPTASLGTDEIVHAWEKVLNPGNFKTYIWQDSSTEPTFTATEDGTYSVTVTDYFGCSASDEINLTFVVDDITLVSLDNPTSSCTLGNSEPVTITVKNTGTTTLASGSSIIVNFTLDGNTTNETVTLPTDLLPNATQQITLTSTMNFTTKKVYPIVVWVEMAGDMTAANNTINVSVEAYQLPVVNLGADFFQETKPAILDAGSGYTSYLWNTAETTQQISVNTAGNYSVTVTNANGCSATDDVNVTFASPDISLISLNNPTNSCALTGNETVTITVKNSGTATLPLGHPITVKYLMDGNTTSESTTLTSQLLPNATQQITLAGTMDFTVKKVYPIKILVEMAGDIDANNDTINVSIEAYPAPVVNLGTDILVENPPATLDAGAGFASYLWNTTETTQQILVNTAGTYSVTVTDANGCSGSDQIVVTFAIPDIALISLDNPTTSCSLTSNEPVTVTVKNTGTATLPLGHPFTVKYTFDGNTTTEQVALTSQLIPNATQQITLAATMDFTNKKVYPIVVWVEMLGDDVSSNNTINVSVEAYQLPVVNLGTDIIQVNPPATLDAGAGSTSYLWNTGATTQQITATVSGNYSVTVTNNNGCAATDEINVRFTSQTLMVANLLTPFSQCVSNTTIPVAFEIINNGVSLLPAGTLIPMGYTFNSNPDVNESLSLASDLAVGSKQTLVFTQKVALNTPGDNRLRIQLYKGLPEEQTSEFIFTGLPTPTFSFSKDTLDVKEFPYLISATGGNSYLWSTGSTASNTQANAPGKYWVEVYGSNGCSVKDTIVIINTTTVGENEFITTLKYYPVPASYELNVETTLKATTKVTIEVLDVTGIVRWHYNYGSVDRLTETIPLNDLKAGTYILRISTTEGISSNIFIINK